MNHIQGGVTAAKGFKAAATAAVLNTKTVPIWPCSTVRYPARRGHLYDQSCEGRPGPLGSEAFACRACGAGGGC